MCRQRDADRQTARWDCEKQEENEREWRERNEKIEYDVLETEEKKWREILER